MHVLVTGAGGFLGQYIAEELLRSGHTVRGLARGKYPALTQLGVEMISADIRDAAAIAQACVGVDAVIHTAAVAGLAGSWSHYYGINTQGTANVLTACRNQGVTKLVFTSSPSVTFAGGDQSGIDESTPYSTRWLCHYSHTKALAEQQVLAANDPPRLMTCSLRPHLIWGPRDSHLIPRLLARARSGQLRRVGDGKNLIDISYVENAALAHVLALERLTPASPVCGQAYFISEGTPVNCWEWINQILALADLPPVQRAISYRAAYTVGGVLEGAWKLLGRNDDPRMTRFLAAQLATSHYYNIAKAHRDLNYAPRVSFAQGMERLAADLKNIPGLPR